MSRRWRPFVSTGLVALLVSAVASVAGVALRDDGVEFPDGSVQTTASSSAVAYPMSCSEVLAATGLDENVTCRSPFVNSFAWPDGVPAGFYFIATDVVVESDHGSATTTGYLEVRLRVINDSGIGIGAQDFNLPRNLSTLSATFRSPLFILEEGDYFVAANDVVSVNSADVLVLGYLTEDPTTFRP